VPPRDRPVGAKPRPYIFILYLISLDGAKFTDYISVTALVGRYSGGAIMNRHIEGHTVDQVRAVYLEDDIAQRFFEWAAGRSYDAAETSIDRMAAMARADRWETIRLARRLDEIGCGKFVAGRKGWKSRMVWSFSLKSLGEAAQGKSTDLKELDPEVAEDAADQQQITAAGHSNAEPIDEGHFTIGEAKRRLAESLGINPEAIEITIRA
jgi:hypothetical protein